MKTACQLRFVHDTPSRAVDTGGLSGIAQLQKDYDGYPSAIIDSLVTLADFFNATNALRGPGVTAATYLFLDKLSTLTLFIPIPGDEVDPRQHLPAQQPRDVFDLDAMAALDDPLFLTNHSIEDPAMGIHGDEHYLYVVTVPPGPRASLDEWRIQVSEHCGFPRWDGPIPEVFDAASWQFDGTLPDAHAHFVDRE